MYIIQHGIPLPLCTTCYHSKDDQMKTFIQENASINYILWMKLLTYMFNNNDEPLLFHENKQIDDSMLLPTLSSSSSSSMNIFYPNVMLRAIMQIYMDDNDTLANDIHDILTDIINKIVTISAYKANFNNSQLFTIHKWEIYNFLQNFINSYQFLSISYPILSQFIVLFLQMNIDISSVY